MKFDSAPEKTSRVDQQFRARVTEYLELQRRSIDSGLPVTVIDTRRFPFVFHCSGISKTSAAKI
jgi:hypothetical protein